MKKVLIVSPHFPPVNAPDMQRTRTVLPYLELHGWEATVLAIRPDRVEGAVIDELLLKTIPASIRVVRVGGLKARWTRLAGFGNLWFRCGRALAAAGDRLLQTESFDLVFFSTTQFGFFRLGPRWRRRFGVPYVLDYQDPWISPYYRENKVRPPGGYAKFALSQWTARRMEPDVLRNASGVVTVSAAYGTILQREYPWFQPEKLLLLPFGVAETDFAVLGDHRPAQPLIAFGDGNFHYVYAGRCGPDMRIALTSLFRAFKGYMTRNPGQAAKVRFHFIGTDYAPPPLGRDWALPIAREESVTEFVSEHRYRVPYFDALYYLKNADALLGIGSNDPTYSASKFFPYLLARRPFLFIFHENSPVIAFAKKLGITSFFTFRTAADIPTLAEALEEHWFLNHSWTQLPTLDLETFRPYTAQLLTAKLAEAFDRASEGPPPPANG
jgi:hypothetical protein